MSEPKDRLGKKLEEKRKGEEDAYFAREDREKLEKFRDKPAPAGPQCPRGHGALEAREIHDVPVDVCPASNGVWLDADELKQVVTREDEGWLSRWLRAVLDSGN